MSQTITSETSRGTNTMVAGNAIRTDLLYLKPDPKYSLEKPYTMNYDTGGVVPRTNIINEPRSVSIQNFRELDANKSFELYGFSTTKLCSALRASEYDDESKVKETFYPEVQQVLRNLFPNAATIEILEHQIRKRHPEFPVATGEAYKNLLPTTAVHIDHTEHSASRSSQLAFPESAKRYKRLLTLNVWKCLQGSGNDWPLGLCDKRSIDHKSQTVAQDIVWADRYFENARVYYHPDHQWYYFKDLAEDEIILFQQSDTACKNGQGVPHTGFFNPDADLNAMPRESIELRVFLYFD